MCNKLLELNSILRLYSSNFSNLHWNTIGEELTDAHVNITEKFVELCNKYIDPTGEIITRLDCSPLNYCEVIKLVESSSKKYLIVDSTKYYNRKEIIEISQIMLKDIFDLIIECLEDEGMNYPANAGIKSELEAILSEFDIQYRYLNKRRSLNNDCDKCCQNPLDTLDGKEPEPTPEEECPADPVASPFENEDENEEIPYEDDFTDEYEEDNSEQLSYDNSEDECGGNYPDECGYNPSYEAPEDECGNCPSCDAPEDECGGSVNTLDALEDECGGNVSYDAPEDECGICPECGNNPCTCANTDTQVPIVGATENHFDL